MNFKQKITKYVYIPYLYGVIVFLVTFYLINGGNRSNFKNCFWEWFIFALSTWIKNIWKTQFYHMYYELTDFNKFDEEYYFKSSRLKHIDFVIDFAFLDFIYYSLCSITGQNFDGVFIKTTIVWFINSLFNAQYENPLMLLFS